MMENIFDEVLDDKVVLDAIEQRILDEVEVDDMRLHEHSQQDMIDEHEVLDLLQFVIRKIAVIEQRVQLDELSQLQQ